MLSTSTFQVPGSTPISARAVGATGRRHWIWVAPLMGAMLVGFFVAMVYLR